MQEQVFPVVGTPEWEAWYANGGEPSEVERVLPDFLEELRGVANEPEAVAARWYALGSGSVFQQSLDWTVRTLLEMCRFAGIAGRRKKGVLSRVIGL